MDIVAAARDDALEVAADGVDVALAWSEVAPWAAHHGNARWVWADTAALYPRLLAAGARVARCHDLRLSRAVLDRAAPAHEAPSWLRRSAPAGLPSLLDGLDGLGAGAVTAAQIAAEHADQVARVASLAGAGRMRLLLAAESAGALIAAEMHADGLPWSRARHEAILAEHLGARPPAGHRPALMQELAEQVALALGAPRLNLDSQVELLRALRAAGLGVTSTSKWELARHQHPAVAPLLTYKKLARLLTANGWAWLDTWVHPLPERSYRFRADYVPGGVVTGRWATSGGGAMQIPKQLRGAVVADPGWRLVVADAAQIEPRVLAAIAGDEALATAGRDGDLYAGLVDAGVVDTRDRAKVGMLGALYGGTAGESGLVMPRLRQAYPRAVGLVDAAASTGERGGTVRTWLGRTCPPPSQAWREGQHQAALVEATEGQATRARSQARSWGRFTRNFVVQGTAAEWALCWMAELRRRLRSMGDPAPDAPGEGRPHLVFFLHDEIVVHSPAEIADDVASHVVDAASAAGRLLFGDFPITFPLDVAVVTSYDEAGLTSPPGRHSTCIPDHDATSSGSMSAGTL